MASGGFLSGAFSGAVSGGVAGGLPGAVVGAFVGGVIGSEQEDSAANAKKKAEKAAERARIASVSKQLGAQQQADTTVLATASKASTSNTAQQTPGGFVGSNLTTSAGTFGQG
jgi:hypothetical protein